MNTIEIQGVQVPAFMYGTAWKEQDTARCVADAIRVGFRAIDTANQRKHYFEAGVGDALAQLRADGVVTRKQLFLQTKFTYRRGQDQRLPYDARADFGTQVRQSVSSSLEHLRCDRIDAYLLHGPASARGLIDDDWRVWRAMEALHDAGTLGLLGISNVGLHQLEALHRDARVAPAFVQNRCYARTRWDREVREFCRSKGIVYQGFSLLTANRGVLRHPRLGSICARHRRSPAQVVFRFAQQVGMLPLTGTTDPAHMREDFGGLDFELDEAEVATIEALG